MIVERIKALVTVRVLMYGSLFCLIACLSIWAFSWITPSQIKYKMPLRALPGGVVGTFRFCSVFVNAGELGLCYNEIDVPGETASIGLRWSFNAPFTVVPRHSSYIERLGFRHLEFGQEDWYCIPILFPTLLLSLIHI